MVKGYGKREGHQGQEEQGGKYGHWGAGIGMGMGGGARVARRRRRRQKQDDLLPGR